MDGSTIKARIWIPILLLGIAALVLWSRYSETRSSVIVFVDAEPITCTGTTVDTGSLEEGSPVLHLVEVDPEMHCVFRMLVTNDAGHDVTISSISWPVVGPLGGTSFEATRLNPIVDSSPPSPKADEIDAVWDRHDVISPGVTFPYTFTIEFRPEGCDAEGSTSIVNLPVVRVKTWFLSATVGGGPASVGFVGIDSPC